MALMQTIYDAGLYLRLSHDDHNFNAASMSIINQRKILTDYVTEMGWNTRDVYSDDGYTGTNFDRPDFKRMIRDVETGKLNCIVVKDMSRLGRNYVECGYYTDEFFKAKGVRFIALNDGIDTLEDNDMIPFHHVVNEIYPKQVSRKVRQVKTSNARQGKFNGSQAAYGYEKSPHDGHILIPEEPAATIIRRIFAEFATGISARAIGNRLNAEGVDSPQFYHYKKIGKPNPKAEDRNRWGSATILQILRNRVYIGDMVQCKRSAVSYKVKKRLTKDPQDWIVVEGMHEAIIDRDTWDRVQDRLGNKRISRTTSSGLPGLFAGLVRCAECGAALAFMRRERVGRYLGVYRCSRYNNSGGNACTAHYIHEADLTTIVLNDIRTHAQLAVTEREALVERLLKSAQASRNGTSREIKARLREIQARLDTIGAMVKSLYEDKVAGKLPEDIFQGLVADYGRERAELEGKRPELYKQLDVADDSERQVAEWIRRISAHVGIDELDQETVAELIDSIEVSEDSGKKLEITIRYRFISNYLQTAKEGIA